MSRDDMVERRPPTEDQFPAFFEEVHGWGPFPWQVALLHRVVTEGWPTLIDVPTGLGKTAVLDVAVFASAMRCANARRRVFMVVDRRLIVDQAHEHALQIQRALQEAPEGSVSWAVRRSLAADGDDGPAVDVTRMRGGVDWSWLWLERPDRNAIVTGTVDQVGSRLLFRGYGVGDRLKPIDAALAGTDSLIVVDEAHLSEALMSTLRDISAIEDAQVLLAPIVVAMSASPAGASTEVHRISADDEQHPVARQRLRAEKAVRLVAVPRPNATAEALAAWAFQLGGTGKVTGVVANTVATARDVFTRIRENLSEPDECVLMTGRIRPVDRAYLQAEWYPRIQAGALREADKATYVVATQTIEVGADIDLDGLVTESASLQALVQRLGRLNRRGGDRAGDAVVVHAGGGVGGIYGAARQQTWEWLTGMTPARAHSPRLRLGQMGDGIPMSPAQLRELVASIPAGQRESMTGLQPYVPLVTAEILDCWCRTAPRPHPDVPVAPYLHGLGTDHPTVALVWRADISSDHPENWHHTVDRIPPSADEAIELPISAARQWLASVRGGSVGQDRRAASPSPAVSDLDTPAEPGEAEAGASRLADDSLRVLRYQGAEDAQLIRIRQVRPNDLIVVPASWGGCDRYGWDPRGSESVVDVADLTGGGRRGRRVTAARVGSVLQEAFAKFAPNLADGIAELVLAVEADLDGDAPDESRYQQIIAQIAAAIPERPEGSYLPHERALRSLADGRRLVLTPVDSADQRVRALLSKRGVSWNDDASAGGTSLTADAEPMTLASHQQAVGARAAQFARNLGIPDSLVRAVELAGAHHDEGKRDRRFQVMLHRGDRWQALAAAEPLAKSGMDPANRQAFTLAQLRSGYPAGMRHEALSAGLAMILLRRELDDPQIDADLVRHLIASHHGYARPLLPPVTDANPAEIEISAVGAETVKLRSEETVDWDGPDRFALLCKTYGRWGLALLEAIVRLADMWCSARSERGDRVQG